MESKNLFGHHGRVARDEIKVNLPEPVGRSWTDERAGTPKSAFAVAALAAYMSLPPEQQRELCTRAAYITERGTADEDRGAAWNALAIKCRERQQLAVMERLQGGAQARELRIKRMADFLESLLRQLEQPGGPKSSRADERRKGDGKG